MELRQIQYFIQLYEDLNFTKASKNLYISQQGLSKSISRLEEELGFALFDRHITGVVPTKEADILFQHFHKISSSYYELQLAIDNIRQNRILKVAGYSGFALCCSKDLLSGYRTFYPQAKIHYEEKENRDIAEHLLCQRADLAFMRAPVPEALASIHTLYQEPLFAVMDRRHPLASRNHIHLQELHRHSLLLLDCMEECNAFLLRQTARQNITCHTEDTAGINNFLHCLHGTPLIGFCSRRMYQYHHFPEIVFVPFAPDEYQRYPELTMETHLVTAASTTPDAVSQQFIDYIIQRTLLDK